jgi:pimeloyl-ACP methyl ester carboxylesterase
MAKHGFSKRTVYDEASGEQLAYWHRPRSSSAAQAGEGGSEGGGEGGGKGGAPPDALVFIHGMGFGPAPYITRVLQMASADAPPPHPDSLTEAVHAADDASVDILMVTLPQASQLVLPTPPPAADHFGDMLVRALDAHGLRRAVLVGHSLGSVHPRTAVASTCSAVTPLWQALAPL